MKKSPIFKGFLKAEAGFVKTKAFAVLIITFLAIKLLFGLFLPNQHSTLASDLTINNILKAVNDQRGIKNLVLLNTNTKLSLAAQSKADDMIARKYFAHVDPDGHFIWDKIVANGYSPYLQLGENLAIDFYDTDSLISAWMNSPTHRANLLQEGFRDQGMGLGFGTVSQGEYYSAIANTFGSLAPAPTPKITQPKPVVTTPAVAPTPKPKPVTKPIQTPLPVPTPPIVETTPASVVTSTKPELNPVDPRQGINGVNVAINNAPDFALPRASSTVATTAPGNIFNPNTSSASAIVGNSKSVTFSDSEVNRYLILICGVFLLLLMLSDIKQAVEKKLGSLDKKTNNFVLLLISLVVIAFVYWF